jgi:hypothetical protein
LSHTERETQIKDCDAPVRFVSDLECCGHLDHGALRVEQRTYCRERQTNKQKQKKSKRREEIRPRKRERERER